MENFENDRKDPKEIEIIHLETATDPGRFDYFTEEQYLIMKISDITDFSEYDLEPKLSDVIKMFVEAPVNDLNPDLDYETTIGQKLALYMDGKDLMVESLEKLLTLGSLQDSFNLTKEFKAALNNPNYIILSPGALANIFQGFNEDEPLQRGHMFIKLHPESVINSMYLLTVTDCDSIGMTIELNRPEIITATL